MSSVYPRARGTLPAAEDTTHKALQLKSNDSLISPPSAHTAQRPANLGNGDRHSANNGSGTAKSNGIGSRRAVMNGGPPLAYTYSPLEHSTDSSWQQIPSRIASVVLGGETSGGGHSSLTDGMDGIGGGGEQGAGVGGGGGSALSNQSKTYRLAVKRTVMSVLFSCCFGLATIMLKGKHSGLEFFAGYLVEQSLSEFRRTYRSSSS